MIKKHIISTLHKRYGKPTMTLYHQKGWYLTLTPKKRLDPLSSQKTYERIPWQVEQKARGKLIKKHQYKIKQRSKIGRSGQHEEQIKNYLKAKKRTQTKRLKKYYPTSPDESDIVFDKIALSKVGVYSTVPTTKILKVNPRVKERYQKLVKRKLTKKGTTPSYKKISLSERRKQQELAAIVSTHERAAIQGGYASQIYEVGRKGPIDDFLQEGFRLGEMRAVEGQYRLGAAKGGMKTWELAPTRGKSKSGFFSVAAHAKGLSSTKIAGDPIKPRLMKKRKGPIPF